MRTIYRNESATNNVGASPRSRSQSHIGERTGRSGTNWRNSLTWGAGLVFTAAAGYLMPVQGAIPTPELQLWLRADSIQGLENGQGISTWTDSSSYGRNATVYTGAPILMNNVLNGKPVVHFTGTQSFAVEDSPVWVLGNNYTIFVVARRNAGWRSDD